MLKRVLPGWWSGGALHAEHADGTEVARRLVARLAAEVRSSGALLVVVGFAVSGTIGSNDRLGPFLDLLREDGVDVLDLSQPVIDRLRRDPSEVKRLFLPRGHYSPEANHWVAEKLAAYLRG